MSPRPTGDASNLRAAHTWQLGLFLAGLVVAAIGVLAMILSAHDVSERRAQLANESRHVSTRHGLLEYARAGEGQPVLVIHGAGGGFDQGLMIARTFAGEDRLWIAPSRFGYLDSALPEDSSTRAQAEAFADLLDQLGLERVPILAFSGGVPPALQFAERYPNRTACLVLMSAAPFTPYLPPVATRPMPDWLYQVLFGSDAIYWLLTNTNRRALEQAFDVRADLRQDLTDEEAIMVRQLVENFLPASERIVGVTNEGAAIDPSTSYQLESIEAPALVIHARDDRLNSFEVAQALAERLPHAELLALETGGHLLLGRHDEIRKAVSDSLATCPKS